MQRRVVAVASATTHTMQRRVVAVASATVASASLCHSSARCDGESSAPPSILARIVHPPPFKAEADSRFDLSTYAGRAMHYIDVLGDVSMVTITREQCDESRLALAAHAASSQQDDSAALWRAKKVLAACVHPETGDTIPAPFRFSAFAPVNLVICGGLLWASGVSLKASAFWQWLNQSYNVGVNHFNRASGSPPPETIAAAYCGATVSAVGVALGLQHLGSKLKRSARFVQLTVPMLGVSVGAVVNLLMTRGHELQAGIAVADAHGNELGRSQLAARSALAQCSATRVAWTVALLSLAPIASAVALRTLPALPRAAAGAVDLGASFVVIWLSVPLCVAIFPQHTSAPAAALEERFRHGGGRLFFNKGL